MKFFCFIAAAEALVVNAEGFNPLTMNKLYDAMAEEESLVMVPGPVFEPWESGTEHVNKGEAYERVVPANFAGDGDDIFMRSVIENYAQEGAECDDDGTGAPVLSTCKGTGVFTLNKSAANALASEVLGTHAGLSGDALTSYLDTYFDKAWGHFDVMQTGSIAAQKGGALCRFLMSDQRVQLGEAAF